MNYESTNYSLRGNSLSELLKKLVGHSSVLVRDEIELAKQEVREELAIFREGAIMMVAGAMLCLVAFMSLVTALIIGLTYYISASLAAVLTGIALLSIGGITVFAGLKRLKKTFKRAGESLNP
jgi:uncharacterized membrane protein YqjE